MLERTRERALMHARKAMAALDGFPPSSYRDALLSLAAYAVDRSH